MMGALYQKVSCMPAPSRSTSEFSFRLRPSSIPNAGVGVFSVHAICKNTYLALKPLVPSHRAMRSREVPRGLRHLSIWLTTGRYLAVPANFAAVDMAWYLNHDAESPNIRWTPAGFFANHTIRANEELLFDYNTLQEAF